MRIKCKLNSIINDLTNIVAMLAITVLLTACGTMRPNAMEVVAQNLSEGKLVPVAAVQQEDVLNLYQHDYQVNTDQPISIAITLDKSKVLNSGGDGLLQVALIARPAQIKKSQIQFLIFDDAITNNKKANLATLVSESKRFIASLPRGSSFVVDSSFKRGTLFNSVLENKKHDEPELIDFVKYYTQQDYSIVGSQLVLIVGDTGRLLKNEKQDVIDMIRILTAKGVRSSVLSYGGSPDYSFYNKIAEVGNGHYRIDKKGFDYTNWLKSEVQDLHANIFTDLNVFLSTNYNMKIISMLTPKNNQNTQNNVLKNKNNIKFKIDKLSEGNKLILFAKVKYPKLREKLKSEVLNVSVNYLDNKDFNFKKVNAKKYIQYVNDKNKIPLKVNARIERSSLILRTKAVITEVVPMIKARRYYNAIAILTKQQNRLKKYLSSYDDSELLRDVKILNIYTKKLYQFDEKWIQFWQINKDLNWDNKRFTSEYL